MKARRHEREQQIATKDLGADGFSWTAALFIDLAAHCLRR